MKRNNSLKKFGPTLILLAILLLAFLLRRYKLSIALADHHSWRQADTAAVTRNFIKEGWSFFKPKIDNMTPLHPGLPNNERLFLVEPPIYNSLVAGVYSLFGVRIELARLVSVFFSLLSIVFLYLIGNLFFNRRVGLMAAFFFAVLPYNIFYSRVVMPEPMIISLLLAIIYLTLKWLDGGKIFYYACLLFLSTLAFNQKAFPLFMLPAIAYLWWMKFGTAVFKKPTFYIWLVFSGLPIIFWRWWIGHFPAGIPANLWLFNENNIRFKGAFFYWIFAKRIGELILGYWGLPIFIIGLILKPKKEKWFLYFWLLGILAFITVFAAGNVTHDYYQIPLIPILCLFLAKGAEYLITNDSAIFSRLIAVGATAVCIIFMLAFGWYQVRDFYNVQGGVDLAGVSVDEIAQKNALVFTGDSNDATLLYNANRWGWSGGYASNFPNTPEIIESIRQKGGSIYVTTKFDRDSQFGRYMLANYQILRETNQFIIFNLDEGDE